MTVIFVFSRSVDKVIPLTYFCIQKQGNKTVSHEKSRFNDPSLSLKTFIDIQYWHEPSSQSSNPILSPNNTFLIHGKLLSHSAGHFYYLYRTLIVRDYCVRSWHNLNRFAFFSTIVVVALCLQRYYASQFKQNRPAT